MRTILSSTIYENPKPLLRASNSAFPFLCELPDRRILAAHQIGQAFESVDGATFLSESTDGGKSWSEPRRCFKPTERPTSESAKVSRLPDGRLIALGYRFFRDDPELTLANPETGGLLDDEVFFSISTDEGKTWEVTQPVGCAWGNHVEASAPITVLHDGSWATPITGFCCWDGKYSAKNCGRLLRSYDGGKNWNDDVICMAFPGDMVTCFEQRMCQLENGTIVVIGWNENLVTGQRYNNHVTFSHDGGKSFSAPVDTGVDGQTASILSIRENCVLTLHSVRRDTDRPGIYACLVDVSGDTFKILEKTLVWEPTTPVVRSKNTSEIFAFLKFGQPGAIRLADGDILMSHWFCEDGMYKTCATRIAL